MSRSVTTPERTQLPDSDERTDRARPWLVVVHNDPVNLMSYVTWVFQRVFGYPRAKAHKLMMEVHTAGRSVVASGPREKSEADCYRLHGYGLWATLQQG